MMDILSHGFMQNALAAGLLASIACGVIGSLVVVNRLVFLAGGIAHTAYGGVGLAFFLGLPVLPTTIGFTMGASLVMSGITLRRQEQADTVVGVLWAAGMAMGIILLDITPGYKPDLMSYLFGSILTVPRNDLWIMLGLDILLVGMVLATYKDLLAMSFDREYARTRGVPVAVLHCVLLAMVAASVVMIIQVVGLILVVALLTIPPYLAERRATSLGWMMVGAGIFSALFCLAGLVLAYALDITSGAAIIAVATACFFIRIAASHLGVRRT